MSSNSVCNHTCDEQIGLPLRGRPILLITRMITDRIGRQSTTIINRNYNKILESDWSSAALI